MKPTVAAVMLVNGRDAMVRRAVECVRAQTYQRLSLVVLDTGESSVALPCDVETWRHVPGLSGCSIGELRNVANGYTDADIIVHFDSDDYSHPRRVEEQVALLEASRANAVGYNEALFWREPYDQAFLYRNEDPSEMLGASICYWRRVWERKPFEATSQGEDFRFRVGLKTVGVSSIYKVGTHPETGAVFTLPHQMREPRFIARIHASNTSNAYTRENLARASEWRRVAEWDSYAKGVMEL